MIRHLAAGFAFALGLTLLVIAADFPKLAPYPAIRWQAEVPEVLIAGGWWNLVAIDGHGIPDIVAFAKDKYDDRWQKRIDEDLVQVLSEMGNPPGDSVTLRVRSPKDGEERTFDDQPMTAENRQAIMKFKAQGSPAESAAKLSTDDMLGALDDFARALDERWSYRHAVKADYEGEFDALRSKVRAGMSGIAFGIELQRIIALGIDGHAGVDGFRLPDGGCLPFLIEPVGKRFVAFKPDRSGFLHEGFPFVATIDGTSLSVWCDVASALVPKGSPQYQRRHALRLLREFDYFRELLQLPKSPTVSVKLLGGDLKTTRVVELPVSPRAAAYGVHPATPSKILEGGIGYLRLATMESTASTREIQEWMPKFRDTSGLIVDVRDNGGGDRDALLLLYSYLVDPTAPPRVFTAAAYRLHSAHPKDHLSARFMVPADSEGLTPAHRQAIATFDASFKPKWNRDLSGLRDALKTDFSPRHYMILERIEAAKIQHYDKPVVVLMNAGCFSATDIFLAGIETLPNVVLMGTPSGGGSARVQAVRLGKTPFTLRIGSMVSFQANGRLFDGYGVTPDVVVEPVPEYFIGGRDNVLEAAVERIKSQGQ